MNHYVYEITNLINGRKYIGKRSCKCPIGKDKYMGSSEVLYSAIEKYGVSNFKKDIIYICNSEDEAYKKEKEYIKEKNANKDRNYYNISEGGNGFTSNDVKKYWDSNRERYLKLLKERQNKRVVLVNNGKIFESCKEASVYVGLKSNTNITMCCKGERTHAGKINGDPAVWIYYSDYLNKDNNEIIALLEKGLQNKNKPVVLLNNCKYFKNAEEAKLYIGLKSKSSISSCCAGKLISAGEIDGRPAIWMYKEEYEKLSKESVKSKLELSISQARKKPPLSNERKLHLSKVTKKMWENEDYQKKQLNKFRKVICINNGEVFNHANEAQIKIGIKSGISKCCKGQRKTAGKINGEPAKWMYYEDYLNMYKTSE